MSQVSKEAWFDLKSLSLPLYILIIQDHWILRTKLNTYAIVLTVRVLLFRVVSKTTIVPVIWDTIIIIIRITGISFTIFIMVSLVCIGDVRAVILVVLVAIFIYVLVVVTLVTNKVIICISLPQKKFKSKFIMVTKYKSTDSLVVNFSLLLFQDISEEKWYYDGNRASNRNNFKLVWPLSLPSVHKIWSQRHFQGKSLATIIFIVLILETTGERQSGQHIFLLLLYTWHYLSAHRPANSSILNAALRL